MVRIRRRFVLFMLCGAFTFLLLYFVINNAAPGEDKKPPHLSATEIQHLVDNSLAGRGEESSKRLDGTIRLKSDSAASSSAQRKSSVHHYYEKPLQAKLRLPEEEQQASDAHEDECAFDEQKVPEPDVQMLALYNELDFTDVDGGVWKQGWDIKYDPLQYNARHKLKVFVVPHSHNDPGWVKTFDKYYEQDTKHILSNALRHLVQNPDMKFIWAEISYFSRFYEDLGQANKLEINKLVKNRQLEFVTGGWVMPDEANAHWQSVLLQLTEGQTWLKQHLNVTPTSSWSIDPFGHSPTLPYILKKSGFQNLLIQRTHYIVKKELAWQRQLEFNWRQLWDDTGETELFTHMMPFYSYDIPHTCGPDPKICCQFDFKRMRGFGLFCPWAVPPQAITKLNVAKRASMLVDQWKKKASLYRTNALLIPLGDDFRYSQSTEWEMQRVNYDALFTHINADPKMHVEAQFGTLQEYFDEVHRQQRQRQPQLELQQQQQRIGFPTLSGDFFTYADRTDDYWSGYFTSRPYHKRMDRVLMHYVRSAELLNAWRDWPAAANFEAMLERARRELSLFQHHDGVTGTAKIEVMQDYARRMFEAVKACKFVLQQSVYRLLTKPSIYHPDFKYHYFYLDDAQWPGTDDGRTTIILGVELPSKHVVIHNSLPQWREELVDFHVASPFIAVTDFEGNPVQAQINPVWTWHRDTFTKTVVPQASTTKYRLLFRVRVPPLGLVTYILHNKPTDIQPAHTSFASNLILAENPITINLGSYPSEVKFGKNRPLSLRVGRGPTVTFSAAGMLKSIQLAANEPHTQVRLQFLQYQSGLGSGAYLFHPAGVAIPFANTPLPVVLVTEGALEASVSVGLPMVVHQTLLRGDSPEIRNLVDLDLDDVEVVMRLSTSIRNADIFYTDLNGLQLIKRKRLAKLPLQANYYPVPSAIYIGDDSMRLSILSAQPLGGAALAEGEMEIMQDRRLMNDDNRGLGEGVLDNTPVWHIFRVVLEKMDGCAKLPDAHPSGALSSAAYRASKSLLSPYDKFIYVENDWLGARQSFGSDHAAAADDIELVAMRNLRRSESGPAVVRDRKASLLNTGVIVHRTKVLQCAHKSQPQSVGEFDLRGLQLGTNVTAVYSTTLTFLQQLHKIDASQPLSLCPMDTQAFIVQRRS